MVKIEVDVPDEILSFIDKKISEGLFSSREEFITHAIRFLAELYGFGGFALVDKILEYITRTRKIKEGIELSETELYVLSLFRESTFLYPEEIWARALEDAYIRSTKPLACLLYTSPSPRDRG